MLKSFFDTVNSIKQQVSEFQLRFLRYSSLYCNVQVAECLVESGFNI